MNHQMISLADQVFEVLEHAILSGEYERGQLLTETQLSEELAVSRTPIREALKRLAMEHIVEMTNRGARVVGILPEDIDDIYEIRVRVEGLVVARAALNMTDADIEELQSTLDLQEFYTQKQDADNLKNMDSRFHQLLYEHCGSNILRELLAPLHRKIMKYRKVSMSIPSRAHESLTEHRAILDAVRERDAAKAEALTIEHIKHARESVLSTQHV